MNLSRTDARKVIEYIRNETAKGCLHLNDPIGEAADLADRLEISREAAQAGFDLLELMGIVYNRPGIGYIMADHIQETMADMLSFIYFLEGADESQVSEFRWMLERTAVPMAVERISQQEKVTLMLLLQSLESAKDEEEQIYYDKTLHLAIVRASRNDFLIASYEALTYFMDQHIKSMRTRIVRGMKTRKILEKAHADMVQRILEGNRELALKGIRDHIGYVNQYGEVESVVEER